MKTKNLILSSLVVGTMFTLILSTSCNKHDIVQIACNTVDTCLNQYIDNRGFELGPVITTSTPQDNIFDATNWTCLFGKPLSKGEVFNFDGSTDLPLQCPVNGKRFAAMWLHPANNAAVDVYREGFQQRLLSNIDSAAPLNFCFNVARITRVPSGSTKGTAKLAIYGIYNTTAMGNFINTMPIVSNINLYGPNNSVKLGVVNIDLGSLTNVFKTYSIPLNTYLITKPVDKIFITRDDENTEIAYLAFDNFGIK